MSDEIAIQVNNISKSYHIYDKAHERLLQILHRNRKQYYREFWALQNVSFEIKKGQTVGIIGQNGSGKSTLLQMIYGTITPTSGSIKKQGRVAGLLELGAGFNPEFTGRENIYLNAATLGLRKKEIDERFDDIAAFADIGDFIEQSIRVYSSGMIIRLGFAIQAQIEPDIIIIDEALAVGDVKFQAKCFERLKQLQNNGTSILLVTHSSEQIVSHCSHAILLEKGTVHHQGNPRDVVNRYLDILFGKERKVVHQPALEDTQSLGNTPSTYDLSTSVDMFSTRPGYNAYEYRWGDGAAKILDFYLAADQIPYPSTIRTGQSILLVITLQFLADLFRPILGLAIKTKEGVTVYGVNTETLDIASFQTIGQCGDTIQAQASLSCTLAPGDYFLSLGIATAQGGEIIPHDRRYDAIHLHILPDNRFFGLANLNCRLTAEKIAL